MGSNRKYSYWIIGVLALIIIVSVIPWEGTFPSGPKVGIVEINMPITVSKYIVEDLNYFNEKSSIIAIVVRLDTPGGGVAASQEIYEKVKKIADKSKKPIIASMGGVAASGGYYIALGADTIIANPGTATGSIGVIMSYPVIGELMDKIGKQYETIKSGKLKDSGSLFRNLTEEERVYFQELIDDLHSQFEMVVSQERQIPIKEIGKYATGRVYSGKQAQENGLIDIEIKVREYKSSSIEADIGFKEWNPFQENLTTTGIDAQARWVIGNIFNTTTNIEFTGRIARRINLGIIADKPLIERDFTVVYRTPWTFYFRIPTRIKYFHHEESEEYDLARDGLTYSLLFNQGKTTRYEFNSTLEIIQSDDSLYTDKKKEPARWMNVKYLSNNIQNPLNPIGGQYLSFISTLSGTVLGGEVHYVKFEGDYRKYLRIQNNSVFAFRILLGYIKNLETENDLPQTYKFELGGQTSLRGWASAEYFEPASIIDMINLEYRFAIKNKFGGELFIDAGRLYETIYEFTTTRLSWDYGIGIIYQTGLGPIRIDIGFPYGELANPQLHASLLYMF